MTLKVAVIAEGNASGAVKAMDQTAAAVAKVDAANSNAAASTNEVAAASLREQAAVTQAAAATKAHEGALRGQAAAARLAAMNQRNLAFQMNDVVVSLISGQAFWMVAAQQGAQVAQIYGPGEGGAGRAFKEMGGMAAAAVTKMWPLIGATALFSIGVAGLQHEINRTSSVTVSWGDVALGVFQTIGGGLYGLVKPAVDAVSGWFEENWNMIVQLTKDLVNNNVRGFYSMIELIGAGIKSLPAVFRIGAEGAANAFLGPIEAMVAKVVEGFNVIIDTINSMGGQLTRMVAPELKVNFGADGAAKEIAAVQEELQKRLKTIGGTDYAGEFFASVMGHATDNYNDRQKDKKTKAASLSEYAREIAAIRERTAALDMERRAIGLSTYDATKLQKAFELENAARKDSISLTAQRMVEIQKEAAANAAAAVALENTKRIYDSLKDAWSGFFSDFRSNIREGQGAISAFADAGVKALNRLTDRFADFAADQAFNIAFSMLSGALGGGGSIAGGAAIPSTGFVPGLTGPRLYANGGIADRPSIFGETGRPEAAVPLPDGRSIPVTLRGGGGPVNNFYVTTPDARSFAESRATVGRAAARFTGRLWRYT